MKGFLLVLSLGMILLAACAGSISASTIYLDESAKADKKDAATLCFIPNIGIGIFSIGGKSFSIEGKSRQTNIIFRAGKKAVQLDDEIYGRLDFSIDFKPTKYCIYYLEGNTITENDSERILSFFRDIGPVIYEGLQHKQEKIVWKRDQEKTFHTQFDVDKPNLADKVMHFYHEKLSVTDSAAVLKIDINTALVALKTAAPIMDKKGIQNSIDFKGDLISSGTLVMNPRRRGAANMQLLQILDSQRLYNIEKIRLLPGEYEIAAYYRSLGMAATYFTMPQVIKLKAEPAKGYLIKAIKRRNKLTNEQEVKLELEEIDPSGK